MTHRPVFLHPGHVFVSADPARVTTILGSCVSVCVYDARRRVGGLNHFLLPHRVGEQSSPRFGSAAVGQLLRSVLALGCHRADLRAKVYGGASVIPPHEGRAVPIGAQNAHIALELLQSEQVRVVDEDLGGSRGRKLIFRTDDGEADVVLL